MKTRIKSTHEEVYAQNDSKRTIGILYNYAIDDDNDWSESFVYIYKGGMYIFFNTIIEMVDYLLYGELKMNRAYMEEKEYDNYYDADNIDDKFNNKLTWTTD